MLGLGTWLVGLAVAFDFSRRALAAGVDRTFALTAAGIAIVETVLTLVVLASA